MSEGAHQFVICVSNEGYEVSLELRKVYEVIPDDSGAAHGLVRVIDESGEEYLFPGTCFERIEISESVKESLRQSEQR